MFSRRTTVAVSNPGTGSDVAGRRIVRHFGLEPEKDVKFTPGGTDEGRLIRLQQGLVDATLVPVPLDLRARKLGLNVLARAQEIYSYAGGGLATTTKKIIDKPEEIKRVINAGIKASRYVKANADGTIQAYRDWRRTDRETAATAYEFLSKAINEDGSLPEQGFRLLIEEIKESVKRNWREKRFARRILRQTLDVHTPPPIMVFNDYRLCSPS